MRRRILLLAFFCFSISGYGWSAENDNSVITNISVMESTKKLEARNNELWLTIYEFVYLVRDRAGDEYADRVKKTLQSMLREVEVKIGTNKSNLNEGYLEMMGEKAPGIIHKCAERYNEAIDIQESFGEFKREVLREIWGPSFPHKKQAPRKPPKDTPKDAIIS